MQRDLTTRLVALLVIAFVIYIPVDAVMAEFGKTAP